MTRPAENQPTSIYICEKCGYTSRDLPGKTALGHLHYDKDGNYLGKDAEGRMIDPAAHTPDVDVDVELLSRAIDAAMVGEQIKPRLHAILSDLAATAREADDTSVFHWQNEVRRCQHERDAAEADRAGLARRVAELEAALREIVEQADLPGMETEEWKAIHSDTIEKARVLAGDGGGA